MRTVLLVVALTLVAAGCGDASRQLAESSTDRLQLEVVVRPDPLVSGQQATFDLQVTNVSEQRASLTFDTTQHGDVALSSERVEVYRWAEPRAFALEEMQVSLTPGQHVSFPLQEARLPVAAGEYDLLATVTGEPKLQTVQSTVTVVDASLAEETPPSPLPVPAAPELSAPYDALASGLESTTQELALPLSSGLADSAEFDADGAVLRQRFADGFARLTAAELLLGYRLIGTAGDAEAARAFAEDAAARLVEVFSERRSVEAADQRSVATLLAEHVEVTQEYARVVAAGGGAPLEVPQQRFDMLSMDLGYFIEETTGGTLETAAATKLIAAWTDALVDAVEEGGDPAQAVERTHAALTAAVEPTGLEVAHAYTQYLDLPGYETTAAHLRQEITSQLGDELLVLATAVQTGAVERSSDVAKVLDENAHELAMAVGRAPGVDDDEESAFLERWTARDAALLEAAASPSSEAADQVAEIDSEIAQLLAEGVSPELDPGEVRSWLDTQREALLEAVRALSG